MTQSKNVHNWIRSPDPRGIKKMCTVQRDSAKIVFRMLQAADHEDLISLLLVSKGVGS